MTWAYYYDKMNVLASPVIIELVAVVSIKYRVQEMILFN